MAINTSPNIRCQHLRHQTDQPAPLAVGVIWYGENVQTKPLRCQPCIDRLETEIGGDWNVVYLDPTRQRRPNPNQRADIHTAGAYNPLRYDLIDP